MRGPSAVAVAFKRVADRLNIRIAQYEEWRPKRVIGGLRPWSIMGGHLGGIRPTNACPPPCAYGVAGTRGVFRPRAKQVLFVNFQHGGTQLAVTASGHSEAGVCHKKSPGVWEGGATIGKQLQQVP